MSKKIIVGEDGREYIVKEKKPFYKKWWFWFILIIVISSMFAEDDDLDSSSDDIEIVDNIIEEPSDDEIVEEESEDEKAVDETLSFKEIAENNTLSYPPKPGSVLVSKGDHNFTGLPYYFRGELVTLGSDVDVFEGKTIWLIKSDTGYVMPVEMIDGESADVGSVVEVWGTLSGEGYQIPNVENVVGETGYLIMMQYSLNGEQMM